MKEFENLKEIWNLQESAEVPDINIIIDKAKKDKQAIINKIIFQIVGLLSSLIGVAWVLYTINFKMATTYIGIGVMFVTIVTFAGLRFLQVLNLRNIDLTSPPQNVIYKLEQFYKFQIFVNTKCTLAYFLFLNIAFGLYFIEVIGPLSTSTKAIIITTYIAWILIAYFMIGKKQIKKEMNKMKAIIQNIKEVENQYKK